MRHSLLLFILPLLFSSCAREVPQPTVTNIDLNRYAGQWHEVARLPNPFEKNLVAARATYQLTEEGTLTVINDGLAADRKTTNIRGIATQSNPQIPGQLEVRFNRFPANLFTGKYWVLALDDAHTRALIGSPKQNFLWLLSKDPNDIQSDFSHYLEVAKDLGYNTETIIWNPERIE